MVVVQNNKDKEQQAQPQNEEVLCIGQPGLEVAAMAAGNADKNEVCQKINRKEKNSTEIKKAKKKKGGMQKKVQE